jgi:hypothetical protein
MMRRFIFLVILSTWCPSIYAEPSSVVEYLMHEPVTMLDWGLYRLKELAGSWKFESLVNSYSFTYYDWDQNRITVGLWVYPSNGSLPAASAEDACKTVTTQVRNNFGTDTNKSFRKWVGIGQFFDHAGFERHNKPAKFMEEVENIINIKVVVFASKEDKFDGSPVVNCESPLMDEEVFILKQ